MSDAVKPLSTVLATLAAAGVSSNAVATASATAASLPPAFANLAAGNVLAGIVIERGRGSVLLKTDKGLLQLATNLPLKIGASVVLEVQSLGAQLRFAVVSVDQRAPNLLTPDVAAELARDPGLASSPRGDGSASPTATANSRATLIGRVVTAEIVAPPQARAAGLEGDPIPVLLRRVAALTASIGSPPTDPRATVSSSPPAPLPAAETLETILAAIESLSPETAEALLNAQAKPANPSQAPAGNANAGRESAPDLRALAPNEPSPTPAGPPAPGVDTAKAPGGTAPQPPKLIAVRLLEILPPTSPDGRTVSVRPAAAGDSISLVGTIVAADADRVELATPLGTLRLPIATGMPVGSRIAFDVVVRAPADLGASEPALVAASVPPQRTLAAEPPRETWAALREIASLLPADVDAGAAIPRPGPALGPALLAFLVGLRSGGSAKAWLGAAAVDSLESSGRGRLLDRLGDEFAAQARAAAAPDRNGWQTMAVSLLDGGQLSEIRVHVQKRRRDGKDGEESGSRFIVEATLSALGPLQLDGLVRAQRFDLIVRTAQPLPEPMRCDIETLFARSLSDTAYSGGVSFRGDAETRVATRAHGARGNGVIV